MGEEGSPEFDLHMAYATDKTLNQKYDFFHSHDCESQNQIAFHRNFDEPITVYRGALEKESLQKFTMDLEVPKLMALDLDAAYIYNR